MPKKKCVFCGTTKKVKRQEDPLAADVDNSPGSMVDACDPCIDKRADDV